MGLTVPVIKSETFSLTVNDNGNDSIGFFDHTKNASIQRLGIEDAEILGRDNTGILVGNAMNTTITECYVSGFVKGWDNVGGLVGRLEGVSEGLISDSYAELGGQEFVVVNYAVK